MGVASLTITPSHLLAELLLPTPMILHSSGLEVLVPKGGMLPAGDATVIPLNWKLRSPPNYFGFLMPLFSTGKEDSYSHDQLQKSGL